MSLFDSFGLPQVLPKIKSIDMHTTGEPTRIIYEGFPDLKGTLLAQREEAKNNYDFLRKSIMLEPRGHFDMYGALLRPETELVTAGEADIGVLFMHNGGFSTMCGHATIALGRFLVDTTDERVFPNRSRLIVDQDNCTVQIRLHAPCGVVQITVPTDPSGTKSDAERPVSFLSTPAFVTANDLKIEIPQQVRWKELGDKSYVELDVAYGGAFYAIISARNLGFKKGLKQPDISSIKKCVSVLKPFLSTHPSIIEAVKHPKDPRLSFLYSIMLVDDSIGYRPEGVSGAETGLCFFAENEIDRSPTGSCVSARIALRYYRGLLSLGEKWVYNSIVSNHFKEGAFTGSVMKVLDNSAVIVQVEGSAYYMGSSVFIYEKNDNISCNGFTLEQCI